MERGPNTMSQLATINGSLQLVVKKPIYPKLTGFKSEIAKASRNGVKVFDLIMNDQEDIITAELLRMLEEANIVAGFKANSFDAKEKGIMISHFFDVFNSNKGWLTLEEFRLIFRMGINGELTDQNFGFNPPTLTQWIKAYKEIRRATLIEQIKYEQDVQDKLEQDQKSQEMRKDVIAFQDNFIQLFESLKDAEDPKNILAEIDPFNTWYGFFTKKGIIKVSNDDKIQIKEYIESTIAPPDLIGYKSHERKKIKQEHQDKIVLASRNFLFKQEILRMAKEGVDMLQLLIDYDIRIYEEENSAGKKILQKDSKQQASSQVAQK
jgi:hypothetical protein